MFQLEEILIKKKDETLQDYDVNKIIAAIGKSADRCERGLTEDETARIIALIEKNLVTRPDNVIDIKEIHALVERSLMEVRKDVAESYMNYRNWVKKSAEMNQKVWEECQSIQFLGDKSNANADSNMVSTKRVKKLDALETQQYIHYFLTPKERQAQNDGYIYIHDKSARLDTMNCCLFNIQNVLSGGFEMSNTWYNEPKSLHKMFQVVGDIVLMAASQQYGGFTIPQVDKLVEIYAQRTYEKTFRRNLDRKLEDAKKAVNLLGSVWDEADDRIRDIISSLTEETDNEAYEQVKKEMYDGFQGWEYKFNTVASSRGDYPFITATFGLSTTRWGRLASIAILDTRRGGQGKKGFKKPVLFPKLVFLYDENLHGPGKELEDVFEAGIRCSAKTMYPDWLSLTGEGYVPSMYKKYGLPVSPMGCRAFLSPWYERGGFEPADEQDIPVFEGRFNIGAVSLNLPMILAKAIHENKDFYEVLDVYLEMIRNIHKRTYDYLGRMKASINPLGFCEGGFYGGHLKLDDYIKPCLKSATASFGITALNELQRLYNGKSIAEDGTFCLEVMEYINNKVNEFKQEDGHLYALYGTPAESLCLHGDTVVQCYGGNKKIRDITTDDLVYSYNENRGCIELAKVTFSGKTGVNQKTVKVVFDNGQEIICTPNHPFAVRKMNRDKFGRIIEKEHVEYIEAKDLKCGDRIKSNYFFYDPCVPNRKMCSIYYNGHRQLVQDIHAEYALGPKPAGYVTHHENEDKEDNSFENLSYVSTRDHRIHHMQNTIKKYQFTSSSVSGERNMFFGKHHTDEAKAKNREAHLGKSIERFDLAGNHIETFRCADDAEKAGFTRNLVVLACRGERTIEQGAHYYKNSFWYYTEDCNTKMELNHKVVNVVPLEETYDVYDITVDGNHNFFVGGDDGILVHNCGKQIEQFRKIYGIVENVSDRSYVSNSFHCHVSENITPIQKQNLEGRFWNLFNGGKIQYVRYPNAYNLDAIRTLVRRAMQIGFYEGVNLSLAYCDDCGHEELEMDVCPVCGSRNLTKIDRMNGYLAFSRIHGDTRLNTAKMAEIKERVSM